MEFLTIVGIPEIVKHIPQTIATLLVLVAMVMSFVMKKRDADVNNASTLGELQNKQLTTLIALNQSITEQLHSVREELSEAYTVIDNLRIKVLELESVITKQKGNENGTTTSNYRD